MDNNQKKIPVKKADGTTVWLTMDEIKKMKSNTGSSHTEEEKVVPPVLPINEPEFEDDEELKQLKKEEEEAKKELERVAKLVLDSKEENELPPQPKSDEVEKEKAKKELERVANMVLGSIKKDEVPQPEPAKVQEEPVKKTEVIKEFVPKEVEEPMIIKKDRDFHSSPLEDKLDNKKIDNLPKVSSDRVNQVDDVLSKVSFPIDQAHHNRLRTVVQLFLKDVRSSDQTEEVLARPYLEGGLELKSAQVDELMKLMGGSQVHNIPMKDIDDLPVPYVEPLVPAKSTPNNSFIHSSKAGISSDIKPKEQQPRFANIKSKVKSEPISKEQVINKFTQASVAENPVMPVPAFKLNSQGLKKMAVNDVISPPPTRQTEREFGPVGEIRNISLTDFRRLSSDPAQAAARVKQKLFNLRDESYLLYIQGLEAWRQSYLYIDYIKVIDSALNLRKPLSEAASLGQGITAEEIKAIVNMEKEL